MMKYALLAVAALFASNAQADTDMSFGIVNYDQCLNDSKYGQLEQKNFEAIRKQMVSKLEETEKEIREITEKKKDTEYMDGLSPKAEEELNMKHQALTEDMSRLQGQYYQLLQQGQYQIGMKVFQNIEQASKKIANDKDLKFVIGKNFLFYYNPDMDITPDVLSQMDKNYEIDLKDGKVSEAPIPNIMNQNVSQNQK